MLAIEHAMRELLNQLITVRWEWLLAMIILTGKLLKSRLARDRQPETRITERATRIPKPGTRNPQHVTRNYVP